MELKRGTIILVVPNSPHFSTLSPLLSSPPLLSPSLGSFLPTYFKKKCLHGVGKNIRNSVSVMCKYHQYPVGVFSVSCSGHYWPLISISRTFFSPIEQNSRGGAVQHVFLTIPIVTSVNTLWRCAQYASEMLICPVNCVTFPHLFFPSQPTLPALTPPYPPHHTLSLFNPPYPLSPHSDILRTVPLYPTLSYLILSYPSKA